MQNYIHSDDLYHWGIKGMRWGVRRYQNKDGSLTPAGKKRYDDDSDDYDSRSSEDAIERRKARILNSDSAKEIYKNRELFTTQELQEAYKRLNTEKLIKDLVPKEVTKGQKFINGISKASATASTLYTAYSNIDKFAKLFDVDIGAKIPGGGNNKKVNTSNNAEKIKDTTNKVKDTVDKTQQAVSGKTNNSSGSNKGPLSRYATMDTSSIDTKTVLPKTVAGYASYGKPTSSSKKPATGVLSKYATMDLSSMDSQATSNGSDFMRSMFDYKLTDVDDFW